MLPPNQDLRVPDAERLLVRVVVIFLTPQTPRVNFDLCLFTWCYLGSGPCNHQSSVGPRI